MEQKLKSEKPGLKRKQIKMESKPIQSEIKIKLK